MARGYLGVSLEASGLDNLAIETGGKRYGNKRVEILSVDMKNSKGDVTSTLSSDEPFSLEYHYKVNDPVDEIIVGWGVFLLDGTWIFGTNTLLTGTQVSCHAPDGRITMECEPLRLFTGNYNLQVSVIGMDETPYDYCQEYMIFHVENAMKESGILHYDVNWKI